jgi:hypothetical protein
MSEVFKTSIPLKSLVIECITGVELSGNIPLQCIVLFCGDFLELLFIILVVPINPAIRSLSCIWACWTTPGTWSTSPSTASRAWTSTSTLRKSFLPLQLTILNLLGWSYGSASFLPLSRHVSRWPFCAASGGSRWTTGRLSKNGWPFCCHYFWALITRYSLGLCCRHRSFRPFWTHSFKPASCLVFYYFGCVSFMAFDKLNGGFTGNILISEYLFAHKLARKKNPAGR